MRLQKLMLTEPMNHVSVLFVIIIIFLKKNSRFQPTVFVKGNDYRSIFKHTSKDKAINIMKNSDLSKKVGSL